MSSLARRVSLILLALSALAPMSTPAQAAPHGDADYTEAYFPMGDGTTTLHADVLRPKAQFLPPDGKTPVIMAVTPYGNHSGSTIETGFTGRGPNERFYDFLNLSGALRKGYTYVQADLPGFGGSSGCNDWGGAREQMAVKAAVEWAASQPWSTGKVALLGKSYDGWTGLMGISQQPQGLAAVVSLEPVYAGYRYLYTNGIRYLNSVLTPALFTAIDAKPGTTNDTAQYHTNGAPQAWCYGVNLGLQQIDDPNDPFWRERDLLISSVGEETPLFLTQGFLETNTKPDGGIDLWNNLDDKGNRAWLVQFDHCRAWETSAACGASGAGGGNRLASGRAGFVAEVMRFLDLHLKGIQPEVEDPNVVVQDNRGRWRGEAEWPPTDSRMFYSELSTGTYNDGLNGNQEIWTFTEPLAHDLWMSGEPVLKVEATTQVPRGNLVADVFDVDESGEAVLISRGAYLLRGAGNQFATFDLFGQDWRIPAGHRIGVAISSSDVASGGFWTHVPTGQTITIEQATLGLPFLYWEREPEEYLDGGSNSKLEGHMGSGVGVSSHINAGTVRSFDLPGPLVERPDEDEEQG